MSTHERTVQAPNLELSPPQVRELGVTAVHADWYNLEGIVSPGVENGIAAGMIISSSTNGWHDPEDPTKRRRRYKYSFTDSVLGEYAIISAEKGRSRSEAELREALTTVWDIVGKVGSEGLPTSEEDRQKLADIIGKYDKAYNPETEEGMAYLKATITSFRDKGYRVSKVAEANMLNGYHALGRRLAQLEKQKKTNEQRLRNRGWARQPERDALASLRAASIGKLALGTDPEAFLSLARKVRTKPALLSVQNLGRHMDESDFWPQVWRTTERFIPAYAGALVTAALVYGNGLTKFETQEELTALAVTRLDALDQQAADMASVNDDHQALTEQLVPYAHGMKQALLETDNIKAAQRNAKIYRQILRHRTSDPKVVPAEWYTPLPPDLVAEAKRKERINQILGLDSKDPFDLFS